MGLVPLISIAIIVGIVPLIMYFLSSDTICTLLSLLNSGSSSNSLGRTCWGHCTQLPVTVGWTFLGLVFAGITLCGIGLLGWGCFVDGSGTRAGYGFLVLSLVNTT